ncbi:hypothetical protein [Photorhabdus antumapuensis]|uniref:hypothetical protein n=1 Tax=Photorhabdus antumapuensis TaxID=2862867 RepID=UPI001CEC3521|nr:hypothetical protein [Photorhabdus antumapuensis]MCA6219137.1 hypothetical protein [Photorhabdus antumapuensis]
MKVLTVILLILITNISGCVSKKHSFSIDYKANGETFRLTPLCIEEITPKKRDNYYSIFIKVKNNSHCSKPFNLLIKQNVGKKLSVFFNNKPILENTNIITPMHVENGFYQGIDSNTTFEEIVNSLN